MIDSIVSAINPQKGQAMVEIGPGLAALTEPVGERLDQLTVIELTAIWRHVCKRIHS